MRVAVPLQDGILSAHFGRCDAYAFVDVDAKTHVVLDEKILISPPHQPGVLPAWVAQMGADVVITGGMGPRAVQLFEYHGVGVVMGAPEARAAELATAYAKGELELQDNTCDGGG